MATIDDLTALGEDPLERTGDPAPVPRVRELAAGATR
jgi:hypothetical protein